MIGSRLPLLLLVGVLMGCGGHGTSPVVIQSVAPVGAAGDPGDAVTYITVVTGPGPYTYAWQFGDAATPSAPTVASPTVTLGAVGHYQARVTVVGANGLTAIAIFPIYIGG